MVMVDLSVYTNHRMEDMYYNIGNGNGLGKGRSSKWK